MSLIRSVGGGWRCLVCGKIVEERVGHEPCPDVWTQGNLKMGDFERLLVAHLDIMAFKPVEGAGDPYQQIAVYAKRRSGDAVNEWKNSG